MQAASYNGVGTALYNPNLFNDTSFFYLQVSDLFSEQIVDLCFNVQYLTSRCHHLIIALAA